MRLSEPRGILLNFVTSTLFNHQQFQTSNPTQKPYLDIKILEKSQRKHKNNYQIHKIHYPLVLLVLRCRVLSVSIEKEEGEGEVGENGDFLFRNEKMN